MNKAPLLAISFVIILSSIILINFRKEEPVSKIPQSNQLVEISQREIDEVDELIKTTSTYDSDIAFFINMKIASGRNRFFVYDLKSRKIIDKGLVAHGSGSETGIEGELEFSNVENSLSTSLGKYWIGKSYNGRFGKAYKLYGLEKTNSNAFIRNIVLHQYFEVPYQEQEDVICNSHGCPMVNEIFYKRLQKLIDNSKKSIVLSVYY